VAGFYTNSLGLVSDAGHMFFDCVALAIGLYASFVAKIKANAVYTYGYARYEVWFCCCFLVTPPIRPRK
jgi:zinc transporter 5/7